jgi:trk system potassium uptake protein TrkH
MKQLLIRIRKWPNSLKIILVSLLTIVIGTVLLALPMSSVSEAPATLWDHFFTSASLVSINSITTVEFAETYTWVGQGIAIILMQVGGLGMMSFLALATFLMDQRLSHTQKDVLSDVLSRYKLANMKEFLYKVFQYTIVMEIIGALLLAFYFVPTFGIGEGVFHSIFLSVSAFTNAGFVNFSASSLEMFVENSWVLSIVSLLVLLGGIGHIVWFDVRAKLPFLMKNRKKLGVKRAYQRLEVYTRLIINVSFILLIAGMVWVLLAEWHNPNTLASYSIPRRFLVSFFQSVTMRTSGFTVIEFLDFNQVTILFLLGLSMIGASPGSTGGGIKTTTVAVIALAFWSELKGQNRISFGKRAIPMETVKQAMVIFVCICLLLYIGVLTLMWIEPFSFWEVFIEATSAVSTVGITGELVPEFSMVGQGVIAFLFFAGRIGPLSLFMGLTGRQQKKREKKYPDMNIQLG